MNDRTPRSVWPLLFVLAAFLVLAVTMPRQWQRIARTKPFEQSHLNAAHRLPLARPIAKSKAAEDSEAAAESSAAEPTLRLQVISADQPSTDLDPSPVPEPSPVPAPVPEPSPTTALPLGSDDDSNDGEWLTAETLPKRTAAPLADERPEITLPRLARSLPVPTEQEPVKSDGWQSPSKMVAVQPSMPPALAAPTTPPAITAPTELARQEELEEEELDESLAASEANTEEEETASIWCRPVSLFAQLSDLAEEPAIAGWAKRTEDELDRLGEIVDDHPERVSARCARLRDLVSSADRLAGRLTEPELAMQLRRAGYALQRRLDVWECVLERADWDSPTTEAALREFRRAVDAADAVTRSSGEGRAWREFLLIDALQEVSRETTPAGAARRKNLSRTVLSRVASTPLTDSQRAFLEIEPMSRLAGRLRREASGPYNRTYLLAVLERYESSGRASDGRRLADECLWLAYWPEGPFLDLQQRIATHYRNANLRIVLTEDLLNQLMPERLPEYERVRDTILGNPVRGESLTATDVAIRLIPDDRRLRLALEITGEVAALTSSNSGPAVFQNTSESHYVARKPMELTVDGLQLWPAEVENVSNVTRLRRVQTTLDGIPVLGSLVKNVAKSQHDMKRSEVRREVERKISTRAKQRIDDETDARLTQFSERFSERILEPMKGMSLGPSMVQAVTTEDRLTMRLRAASRQQLGANTPRPMAPADSRASFQIHQTALNNMIEQLDLDGQTMTLPELRARLAERLNWPEVAQRTTENDDVTITFADKDAVRVTCEDGLVTVDLAIERLRKSRRSWRNFQVRVSYRPVIDGLSAELVRDGVVKLPGPRLSTNAQVALRAIFCKIFSQHATREIVPEQIRNHPKLGELAVTQMVIEDGWIAFALGRKARIARSPAEQHTK